MYFVALQRDVLEERRDHIRSGPELLLGKGEEMIELRKKIQIFDNRWVRNRVKDSIDLRRIPLITSDEWGRMVVGGLIPDSWGRWDEREPNGQW